MHIRREDILYWCANQIGKILGSLPGQDWHGRRLRFAVWSYLILSLLLLLGVCEKGSSSHSRQSVRQLAATRCWCPIPISTWLYWHGEEHDLTEYC